MSFLSFILFGHICITQPNDLDTCWNIYNEKIRYQSSKACHTVAKDIIAGAKVYYRKKGGSITQLELYCLSTKPTKS